MKTTKLKIPRIPIPPHTSARKNPKSGIYHPNTGKSKTLVGWDRRGSPRDPGFRFIFEINTRCRTGRNTHGAHRRGPLAFALFQERRRGGRQPRCARSRQPRAAIAHWGTHESTSESSHIVADRTGPSPVGHALPVAASFAVPTPAKAAERACLGTAERACFGRSDVNGEPFNRQGAWCRRRTSRAVSRG